MLQINKQKLSTQNYTNPYDDQKYGWKAWTEDMGQFLYHLDPITRKITMRLEKIKLKTCLNNNLLFKYIYIYIYIYKLKYTELPTIDSDNVFLQENLHNKNLKQWLWLISSCTKMQIKKRKRGLATHPSTGYLYSSTRLLFLCHQLQLVRSILNSAFSTNQSQWPYFHSKGSFIRADYCKSAKQATKEGIGSGELY